MVNFSIMEGLVMPIKKYLILSLIPFIMYSCGDNPASASAKFISGQWESDQYIYSPNCSGLQLSFDDYISYLVTIIQEETAEDYADFACTQEEDGWCDLAPTDSDCILETNSECLFQEYLDVVQIQWENDSTLTNEVIANNTVITDVIDIELNINPDNTYTISWDGVCVDYNDLSEQLCNAFEDNLVLWDGTSCEILTEDGCVLEPVDGTWDDGSSGVLDENSDNYVMDDVDDQSVFEGTELIFDGDTISITVISSPELCVSLNFTK